MPPPTHLLVKRTTAALRFAAAHSVYPWPISIQELGSAQVYLLSLVYSLLVEDRATVHVLLAVADRLPLLRSSYLRVWLRDDYRFKGEDVAKVLSELGSLLQEDSQLVPEAVLSALEGLQERYAAHIVDADQKEVTDEKQSAETGLESCHDRTTVQTRETGVQATPKVASVGSQASLGTGSAPTSPLQREPDEVVSTNLRYSAERRLLDAAESGDFKGAAAALEAGAVADCRSLQGLTPLHLAVKADRPRLVGLLLGAGAIVDSRHSATGATPLHSAASLGRGDCALILLEAGANPTLKDWKGRTPLQVALKERHFEVAQLIRSKGGV